MNAGTNLRRRIATGLVLAAAAGVGLSWWVLARGRAQIHGMRAERAAVVTLRTLSAIVERGGGTGDGVRAAVARFAAEHAELASVRVVAMAAMSLEASTAPADVGERAAPRRLARDEKELYDLGQRLRQSVATNREEGAARKAEIEVAALPSGGFTAAAPVEQHGEVSGFVTIATRASPAAPPSSWTAALLALLAPLAGFFLVTLLAGDRRLTLLVAAAVLLALGLAGYGHHAFTALAADRRAAESAIGSQVRAEAVRATTLVSELALGDAATLDPASWDCDAYRRPRGLVAADGSVDEDAIASALQTVRARLAATLGFFAVVSLALLLFVGLGSAERVAATLKHHRQAYYYVAPALFGMLVLVFLPFLYGVALSFTDFSLFTSQAPISEIWVGFKNFIDILGDFRIAKETSEGLAWNYQNFYWTLGITLIWTVTNVAYGVGMGLFLALILNTKGLLARPIYRVIFILPWAMPNYITALIWKGMFHQQFGVINRMIEMAGGSRVAWFEGTWTSLFACIVTNAWLSVPFMMVISLGALQSIPADLYEAARVDGATRWQQFRQITLPSLKPALVPAVILSVIWTFNMFNIIYLVSGGEPAHSTEILITQAYKFAFEQYRYGYAAAYSMVIFGILLVYGTWQNKVTKATEGI